jgi:hypothetical protein
MRKCGTFHGTDAARTVTALTSHDVWAWGEVELEIKAAFRVFAMLRDRERAMVRGNGSSMPDYLHQWGDEHWRNPGRAARPVVEASRIARAEAACAWLLWLGPRNRMIVSGRCAGAAWRRIMAKVGLRSRDHCYRCHVAGLTAIAERLTREGVAKPQDIGV